MKETRFGPGEPRHDSPKEVDRRARIARQILADARKESTMGDSLQTSVRAKLQLTAVTEHAWGGKTLRFEARYDQMIPEDRRFQQATPSGYMELQIDNPMALGQFKNGENYYVDFTSAPKT